VKVQAMLVLQGLVLQGLVLRRLVVQYKAGRM
jgi:hypothetical protein